MKCALPLVFLLTACTLDDLLPDRFTVGAAYTDYHHSQGLGIDSNPYRLTNLPGGDSSMIFASLGFDIGYAQPRSDLDFERWRRVVAESKLPEFKILPDAGPKPIVDHPTNGWMERFTHATFTVQCLIVGVILSIIGAAVWCRRSLVQLVKYAAFWRARKAPTDGDGQPKK